jgi:hypothetical protein
MQVYGKLLLAIFILLLFFIQGCFNHWSEKEKQDFKIQCSQTDSFQNLSVTMRGFSYSEIDTVFVKEFSDSNFVDSFYLFPRQNSYDKSQNQYLTYIERLMLTKHSYVFFIKGQKPYVLDSMKMVIWPQWTMASENYGCVMGEFLLNGTRHKHDANPILIKE